MEAAEQVGAALRRYRWLLLGAVLAGIAASVLAAQLRGERHEATAQVLQRGSEAALVLGVGTSPDPQREGATGVLLTQSARFYRDVADALPPEALDGPGAIRGDFEVRQEPGTDVLGVTGASEDPAAAVAIANAAAERYVSFRAEALAGPIREAIRTLQEEDGGAGDAARLEDNLARLRLLENLQRRGAAVVDPADRARQTRPAPLRDALIGLTTGLVAGLLLMALFEALTGRSRAVAALERRLGARAAVVLPAGGLGRDRAEQRLGTALRAAVASDGPGLVGVEAPLDATGAADEGARAVSGALAAAGDRVRVAGDERDLGDEPWPVADVPDRPARGSVSAPAAPAATAREWVVLRPGDPVTPADAVVTVVRARSLRSLALRMPSAAAGDATPRLLLVLED